jgi:hypothetical protein
MKGVATLSSVTFCRTTVRTYVLSIMERIFVNSDILYILLYFVIFQKIEVNLWFYRITNKLRYLYILL